ncbi:MAG: hypothetical protein K1X55_16310 [Chitinophagales bacterium]|nr:hypothetical protein [Chitinophagales bacterium]
MSAKSVVAILLVFTVVSCRIFSKKETSNSASVVAEAYDQKLYLKDIPGLNNMMLTKTDSQQIIAEYANTWLNDQVMLKKANDHLSLAKKKDIELQAKKYETTLSIYEYEKELLLKDFDTSIAMSDLQKYYKDNTNSYSLEYPIVKFVLVKNFEKSQEAILKSMVLNQTKYPELKKYAMDHLLDYSADDSWKPLYLLRNSVPDSLIQDNQLQKTGTLFNIQKEGISILLYIKDVKLQGQPAPYDLVAGEIRSILLNQKKADFIKNSRKELMEKEIKKKKVKIYE